LSFFAIGRHGIGRIPKSPAKINTSFGNCHDLFS
jgi:hypothetical protein